MVRTTPVVVIAAGVALTLTVALCNAPIGPVGGPGVGPAGPGADDPVRAPIAAASEPGRRALDPVGAARGFYSAPLGTELRFRYAASSSTVVGTDGGAASGRIECRLAGELLVAVVARDGDELVVEWTMPGTNVEFFSDAGGESLAAQRFAEQLAEPTLVRMRDDGTVLGIRFPSGMGEEAFNWLRSLVAAARFVVHTDGQEWSCVEPDAGGISETLYRWSGSLTPEGLRVLGKTKRAVRADGTSGAEPGSLEGSWGGSHPELHGEGRSTLDSRIGWLCEAEYRESMRLELPDTGGVAESTFTSTFHLERSGRRSVFPVPALAGEWDTMDGRATARACADRDRDATLAAELQGVTVRQLLASLDGNVQVEGPGSLEQFRLVEQLAALVRLRGEVVGELQQLLSSGGWRPETLDLAVVAIARAGTDPAQSLLAGFLANASADPALGLASVRSVFAIERPGTEIATAVARVARESADPETRVSGVLATGCAAGRASSADRSVLLGQLRELESDAERRGELAPWFEALGNAGLPECVEMIRRHLQSADPQRRAACLVALRRVPDEIAYSVLSQAVGSDPSSFVRTRALEVLADRGGRDSIGLFRDVIGRANEPDVLRAAVRGLAVHAADPLVREALQGIADGHPSADARRWAREALSGRS